MSELSIDKTSQGIIDSLLEHIAVMDSKAEIISTNSSWEHFAKENGAKDINRYSVGANYLDVCNKALKNDKKLKELIYNLKQLLKGNISDFTYEYPCHSPYEKRWFLLYASAFIRDGKRIGAVVSHINITKRKLAELEAIKLAKYDSLTSTLNRKFGIDCLQHQINLSNRYKHKFTICYLDIDNLKSVNDNLGHIQGDILISQTAKIIMDNLRITDKISRVGGDEFLIIFPHTEESMAEKILIRINDESKRFNMDQNKPESLKLSFSYGLAEYNPEEKISLKRLVESADTKMYKNKTNKKPHENEVD